MNDISETQPDPLGKELTFINIPENSTKIIRKG